ncbi:MAG: hypothetical protein QXV69_05925 [Sulfolobaceae archaeon]
MSNLEVIVEDKLDFRMKELMDIYPNIQVTAILVVNGTISEDLLNLINSKNIEIIRSYPFMRTIKVKGKVKDIATITSLDRIKYIMLDEILSKSI